MHLTTSPIEDPYFSRLALMFSSAWAGFALNSSLRKLWRTGNVSDLAREVRAYVRLSPRRRKAVACQDLRCNVPPQPGRLKLLVPIKSQCQYREYLVQFHLDYLLGLVQISPLCANSTIWSAARKASAWMVIVGWPRPELAKLEPSQINRFGTSCER